MCGKFKAQPYPDVLYVAGGVVLIYMRLILALEPITSIVPFGPKSQPLKNQRCTTCVHIGYSITWEGKCRTRVLPYIICTILATFRESRFRPQAM